MGRSVSDMRTTTEIDLVRRRGIGGSQKLLTGDRRHQKESIE